MIVFDRHTSCQVEELNETQVRVTVSMSDNYHQIVVSILVELPEGMIIDAQVDFIRVPNEMCRETGVLMSKLIGVVLGKGIRKKSLEIFGGATGCVHLKELVIQAAEALYQGRNTINYRQFGSLQESLDNISAEGSVECHYHTENKKRLAQK